MNVRGIKPIIGSSCATQNILSKKAYVEKPDSFEAKKSEEKKDFKTKVKEFFVSAKKNIAVVLSALVAGLSVFAAMSVII